jgi:peptide deformylase
VSSLRQFESEVKHIKLESINDPKKPEIDRNLASLEREFTFWRDNMITKDCILVSGLDVHKILTSKAGLWPGTSDTIKDMFHRMINFVNENTDVEAVSLPQLGVPYQGFVCKLNHKKAKAFVNPHIVELLGKKIVGAAQCLSSNKEMPFEYNEAIILSWRDLDFNLQNKKFTGDNALIIQHMVDHLRGKLIFE